MARAKDDTPKDTTQTPVALTGHVNEAAVVEDPATGKVQAIHTTTVVTDPESELAVQGHDDPRVNGALADPLNREPSPNEQAEAGEADVTVGGASDESIASGNPTAEDGREDDHTPD